jgi:hypothetical protein
VVREVVKRVISTNHHLSKNTGCYSLPPLTEISSRDSKSRDKRGELTYDFDLEGSLDTWFLGSARSPT